MAWLAKIARKQVEKTMTLFSRLPIWSQEFKLPRTVVMRVVSSPWNSCNYWLTRTYQYMEAAEMKNDLPCKLNFWSLIYSIYIIWKPINMPLRFQSFISARIIMINATLLSRVLPPHLQCWASVFLPTAALRVQPLTTGWAKVKRFHRNHVKSPISLQENNSVIKSQY